MTCILSLTADADRPGLDAVVVSVEYLATRIAAVAAKDHIFRPQTVLTRGFHGAFTPLLRRVIFRLRPWSRRPISRMPSQESPHRRRPPALRDGAGQDRKKGSSCRAASLFYLVSNLSVRTRSSA